MKGITRLIFCGTFFLFSVCSFTQSTTSSFTIKPDGPLTVISAEGLSVRTRLKKPATIPELSEPATWTKLSETTVQSNLGGVTGSLRKTTWKANTGIVDYESWISDNNDLVAFRQVFTNTTSKTIRLNSLYPFYVDGRDGFWFGNTGDWRILEQFRHKNDMPVAAVPAAGMKISCDPFLIINDNKGTGRNLLIGFQTFSLHLAQIDLAFTDDMKIDRITTLCDFEGVEMPPQSVRTSQWVVLSAGNDAWQLTREYTGRIREYYDLDKPQANAPTVYCTWYYHADNYNEEIFRHDIEQFRKEHLPFDVFLIDECWDLNDWGDFEPIGTFPSGMKWVAGQINSAGYTPGIWTAPFLVDAESDLAKNHPLWLLKNSKGEYCRFNMNGRDHFIFDLTYPGVCGYLEESFRKISHDWGYRYFKFDFMRSVFIDAGQQFHDKTSTSLEAYRKGLEAIRRGTGNDAYISVCGGHYGASYGIANTQRSGSDVKSQWNIKELPKYRQNVLRTWMSDLWHVDPDAMMVRKQEKALDTDKRNLTTGLFTDDEAFTNTLNQFIGGNLITFTEDFAAIGDDRKMLYRHVIPSPNTSSRPIDLFDTLCPGLMLTHIEPVCRKLNGWNMLSVVNWSDETKSFRVNLNDDIVGNLKGQKFIIYDFRKKEIAAYRGVREMFEIENVEPHQGLLFKIVPWDGNSPMFVGTDLNFSCGGLEISDIENGGGTISGTVTTGWNVPVDLAFVYKGINGPDLNIIQLQPGQKTFHAGF